MPGFQSAERMLDVEVEPQGLRYEVLRREDGVARCIWNLGVVFVEPQGEVFAFAGDEHGGSDYSYWRVGHGRVVQVEAADKLDACCLCMPYCQCCAQEKVGYRKRRVGRMEQTYRNFDRQP